MLRLIKHEYKNHGIRPFMLDLSIAMFIVANSLAWVLPVSSSPLVIVVLFVFLLFLFGSKLRIQSFKPMYIVAFSLLLFVEAFIRIGFSDFDEDTNKYLTEFVVLGIPSMFMANTSFRPYKVLEIICVLSVPFVFYVWGLNMLTSKIDYGYWMGISYGIVKYIIVLFLVIFFIRKSNLAIRLLLLAVLFSYILFYLEYASRGAILAVIISIGLFYLVYKNYSIKKTVLLLLLLSVTLSILFYGMLQTIYYFLQDQGIESFALHKMLFMVDITNGRENLSKNGIEIFMNSPIIGFGAGIYEREYGKGYIHNCLIQFLDEGGIVYFVIMLIVIGKSFKYVFDRRLSNDERYFMAFLISGGFVQLLFSSYFWGAQCFWLMIGYAFFLSNKLKYISHENTTSSI